MNSRATEDLYLTLQLQQDASGTAIRQAYRRLARLRHPDKNPQSPTATGDFQNLQHAYQILSDPVQRQQYDATYLPASHLTFSPSQEWSPPEGAPQAPPPSQGREYKPTGTDNALWTTRQELDDLQGRWDRMEYHRIATWNTLNYEYWKLWVNRQSLDTLRGLEDKHLAEECVRESRLKPPRYLRLSVDERAVKNRETAERRAAIRYLEGYLTQSEASIHRTEVQLHAVGSELKKLQSQVEDASMRHSMEWAEWNRKKEEKRRRVLAERQRQKAKEVEQQKAEEAARQKAKEAERQKAEEVERQKAKEVERQKAEEAARQGKATSDAPKKPTNEAAKTSKKAPNDTSRKEGLVNPWLYYSDEGRWHFAQLGIRCSLCRRVCTKYAFRCPGCGIMACSECRRVCQGDGSCNTHRAEVGLQNGQG